jgi:hypothetical protein
MTKPKLPVWLIASLALTALLSTFSVYKRWQVENENRATSLAVEYENVEGLAAAQGIPIDKALVDLKAQGVNALVLSEETVGELIARGQATLESTSWVMNQGDKRTLEPMAALSFTDVSQLPRAERGLHIRFQKLANRLSGRSPSKLDLPPVSPMLVRTTPIGLNPNQVDVAKRNGMLIIARCANPPGVSATGVRQTLEWAHDLGASVFLPEGDQVLGRREAIQSTLDALRDFNMFYATPEFAKIGGDVNMVEGAPWNVVRLHSAQIAELDKLTFADAVDRFAKAARERNMRILLIRPFTLAANEPNASLAEFIKKINEQIVLEGGAIGKPKPYREPGLPKFFQVLLGLAIAPAIWFTAATFIKSPRARMVGAGLLGLLALGCVLRVGQHGMAFLASISFPLLGFIIADGLPAPALPKWLQPLPAFLLISLFSLLGGLCVAGLLNGLTFYVKADEFKGIKVAVFLPIIGVGAFYLSRIGNLKKTMASPINWSSVLLGFLILGMLGLMIARTGNDNGVGASDGEVAFRGILDRVMFVRPRTKEFLIGHPLLIIGLGLLYFIRGTKAKEADGDQEETPSATPALAGWAALAMMVGSMGQTDIVNTLCHLHIPVLLSVIRIGIGALLGCIIGIGLWAIALRWLPKSEA